MPKHQELEQAINYVLMDSDESDLFKRMLTALILNSLEDSYLDEDLKEVIDLVNVSANKEEK